MLRHSENGNLEDVGSLANEIVDEMNISDEREEKEFFEDEFFIAKDGVCRDRATAEIPVTDRVEGMGSEEEHGDQCFADGMIRFVAHMRDHHMGGHFCEEETENPPNASGIFGKDVVDGELDPQDEETVEEEERQNAEDSSEEGLGSEGRADDGDDGRYDRNDGERKHPDAEKGVVLQIDPGSNANPEIASFVGSPEIHRGNDDHAFGSPVNDGHVQEIGVQFFPRGKIEHECSRKPYDAALPSGTRLEHCTQSQSADGHIQRITSVVKQ